jgi:acetyl esterase
MFGSLDGVDHLCRQLADRIGALVVSVDYRLAPEHPFPAALDDATTVLHWVAARADALGVRAEGIGIGGDSAGANLAVAACLRDRDRGERRASFLLLAYPVADHDLDTRSYRENAEGMLLTREMMRAFWEAYAPGERAASPYVSVLHAPLHDLPPALVLTASHDPLRDEGEELARGLTAAGVATRCVRFEGTVHGFLVRYPILSAGRVALDLITDVFRQWARGESWQHVRAIADPAAFSDLIPPPRPTSPDAGANQ